MTRFRFIRQRFFKKWDSARSSGSMCIGNLFKQNTNTLKLNKAIGKARQDHNKGPAGS